ncbi:McbB family protein [Pseudomonas sp. NPDC089401]|uniref:McbB family protein n=1 Tax=Pseudomonas sp. NPDC089401 TaxID=3364462 RepID=UPI0037F8514E
MKMLRVHNYEILNFESDPVLFTSVGFTRLVDPKITRALARIEGMNAQYLSEKELETVLLTEDLQPTSATHFLKSLSVIGEAACLPHFKSATIFTDLPLPNSLKKHMEEQRYGRLKILPLPVEAPFAASPALYIFACMTLRPHTIKFLYHDTLKKNPSCAVSIGFVSGNSFHLTEAYLPEIGNPCAFCTLDRISYYENLRGSHHNWSNIWAFCNSNNMDMPTAPLNEYQATLIMGSIAEYADKLTRAPKFRVTQDRNLTSRTLNLQNGALTEDSSIHWPLCECIGGGS